MSFHETKNVSCGEGGVLLINDPRWVEQALIIREKGTDRSRFFRGQTDKYTWVDIGSSYLLSEISAAFLWAQLEEADALTQQRLRIWDRYHEAFAELEYQHRLQRPVIPPECRHNGHMYYLLLPNAGVRSVLLKSLNALGINAVFHYIPLHSSPAGKRYGRPHGNLSQTDHVSDCLVRLPLWIGMTDDNVTRVVESVYQVLQ
jgi:dTDP-4-amino-4,6-dideoxygalactose transaminase